MLRRPPQTVSDKRALLFVKSNGLVQCNGNPVGRLHHEPGRGWMYHEFAEGAIVNHGFFEDKSKALQAIRKIIEAEKT